MTAARSVLVFATLDDLIAAGIEAWQAVSQAAVHRQGQFRVALAGGSTPQRFYQALASVPGIPWAETWVFWGDERYVPQDHSDSNARMAQEALLAKVPIPPQQIFPWPTDSGDPAIDAARYETTLRQVFGDPWPQWDLLLLGMGDDGHTASLFPGTTSLQVTDRWTAVGNKGGEPRLTLTYPAINASQQVMIWVAGASKVAMIQQVLGTAGEWPIQRVKPQGSLVWMLDRVAAAGLPWV
ncbi:MAG: 6-phosphogluconolactonase [Synechococcales cyanobacterium]